jgi:DNA-binding NarL/FixJ family response regulator
MELPCPWGHCMSKLRVLLADDHAVVREGLKALINAHRDMEVIGEAANGKVARDKAGEMRPDIVVMDVSMPDVNGVQATSDIRRRWPEVRVLVLTVHEERSYLRNVMEAGASGYVLKRSAPEDLVHALRVVARGDVYLDPSVTAVVLGKMSKALSQHAASSADLSERETEVLQLIAHGHSNKDIAGRLDISVKTVETYKARSMEKLGLNGRADIVRFALEEGWLRDVRQP